MNLRNIKDQELLTKIKSLVQNERDVLTQILHHLREVEVRKLFSELGYANLFEYAVRELKYGDGQAARRISAMRLIQEMPQVEQKIQDGSLSLSNLSQAQSYFRTVQKTSPIKPVEKLEILEQLENKSAREGEKLLLSLQPSVPLPKEKERQITETHTEIKFVMDEVLKQNLEQVRSLLGTRGLNMSFAELAFEMSQLSISALKAKHFGKRRTAKSENSNSDVGVASHPNYISKAVRYEVWQRDQGRCTKCSSKMNLNIDHIRPRALGGGNDLMNLRLLCFHCNQRRAFKTFGVRRSDSHC